jgi:ABC-type nitrate/sulfonate/bicarbonate transport system ATPase subunit
MGGGIEIRALNFSYREVPIFVDFGFETHASRILIRGPSGCGKTTLLKLIAGILRPHSAGVLTRPSPAFTVLQNDGLVPWLSGRENIALYSETLWERIREGSLYWLIEPFVEQRACDMSFGQRRSVELVCALQCGRPLLLLDEPLSFLDRDRRSALLAFLNKPGGCASQVVMTSHYEDAAAMPSAEVFEFGSDLPHSSLGRAP